MKIEIPNCRKFTGYKPCHPGEKGETCISPEPTGEKVLIINIEALGAVLMTTTILPAIKREYPDSVIHWLTEKRAAALLEENQYVDFVHVLGHRSLLTLQEMKFDIVMNSDKIQEMCALTNRLKSDVKLGFGMNEDGVIIPLNEGAEFSYRMGINNLLKFKQNTRSHPEILREMFNLDSKIDNYVFNFTAAETEFNRKYKESLNLKPGLPVIGINTGSSVLFSNKRITDAAIRTLIPALYEKGKWQKVVLLGGIEDTERNQNLTHEYSGMVINTPTNEGLRKGLSYVDVCDIVITGDSLGMHMAIALGKKVCAYFNITCAAEIELYERGEKVLSEVECSPCWKRECDKGLVCLEEDIAGKMLTAVDKLFHSFLS